MFFSWTFQIGQLHTSLHNELVKSEMDLEAWIKVYIASNKMNVIKWLDGHQNTDNE